MEHTFNRVLVCLNDKKSRVKSSPVCYDSFEAAQREVKRAVELGRDIRDGQKPIIAMYPEDFELVYVADFDPLTGVVTPRDGHVYVAVDELFTPL